MAIAILGIAQFTYTQEQGKFRVGFESGYAIPSGGGGILSGLEAKQNISDNMNVGIRFENAAFIKEIELGAANVETELSASISFIGTFDYYFNRNRSLFSPFLGGGVGYNLLGNAQFSFEGESFESDLESKPGGLVRAGFELGKLRLCAAYNLIGKSDLGQGSEVKNSYFGISLGFYVGGGKWKK